MQTVKNKKAISRLAVSGIKSNIKKYIVLIGAVILTTLQISCRSCLIRQYVGTSH